MIDRSFTAITAHSVGIYYLLHSLVMPGSLVVMSTGAPQQVALFGTCTVQKPAGKYSTFNRTVGVGFLQNNARPKNRTRSFLFRRPTEEPLGPLRHPILLRTRGMNAHTRELTIARARRLSYLFGTTIFCPGRERNPVVPMYER